MGNRVKSGAGRIFQRPALRVGKPRLRGHEVGRGRTSEIFCRRHDGRILRGAMGVGGIDGLLVFWARLARPAIITDPQERGETTIEAIRHNNRYYVADQGTLPCVRV